MWWSSFTLRNVRTGCVPGNKIMCLRYEALKRRRAHNVSFMFQAMIDGDSV